MAVQELSPEASRTWKRWQATAIEWLAVIVACIAVAIALSSYGQSVRANVRSELLQEEIVRAKNKTDLYIVYVQALHSAVENDKPLPELPEN